MTGGWESLSWLVCMSTRADRGAADLLEAFARTGRWLRSTLVVVSLTTAITPIVDTLNSLVGRDTER